SFADDVTRRQRLTLIAAILGSAVVSIDGSIISVALPAIQRDLGGGLSGQQWVSNAYLLTLGSLILIGGSLGDIYGERRVFAFGVAAFGALSLACALAPTMNVLIAARAPQGAAGALVTPSSLALLGPVAVGVVAFAVFLGYERRAADPMLELGLFARRNFAIGNVETLAMYAGLAILFFFLVIFLQQVAGFSALKSGLTTLPVTIVMFMLSRRFGALADRFGPRLFMGAGPLIGAAGILLLLRAGMHASFLGDLLPGLLVFA